MKVLILTSSKRTPANDLMHYELSKYVELTVKKLSSNQQKYLRFFCFNINFHSYDVVISDLFFKRIFKQVKFFRKINNLVVIEYDACQNKITSSKWHGKFDIFYDAINSKAVLLTGINVAKTFSNNGVNAFYIPKGYNHHVRDNGLKKDIEFGFIGRLDSNVYQERKKFLYKMKSEIELKILRASPGAAYAALMNKIRFFISADIGLGEYMAKNFEAMAAGCIVCAYRQGEEDKLGLKDMENIVLYSNKSELLEKIDIIKNNTDLEKKIRYNASSDALINFSYSAQAKSIHKILNNRLQMVKL